MISNRQVDKRSLEAAADHLSTIGSHHGWWSRLPASWRDLDPIGRSEFLGIVEEIIKVYLAASSNEQEVQKQRVHSRSPIKLSRLRDIGWKEWDPIGLLAEDDIWDHKSFADEYDHYLMRVAGGFRSGWKLEDAAEYLLSIEREHMGLGFTPPDQMERAEATARAIQLYMAELDGEG